MSAGPSEEAVSRDMTGKLKLKVIGRHRTRSFLRQFQEFCSVCIMNTDQCISMY